MAVAVVNKKQTGSTASATLTITSATKGNLLVAFIAQNVASPAPTGKDNKGGTWVVNATAALYGGSGKSLWVATKFAEGGETELDPTAGGAGAVVGISYFEVSGAGETVDAITHKDNVASATTVTSEATTTTEAGDIVLACVATTEGSGTVLAWTGTGPMTNTETTATRCIGGSYIPGSTLSAVTFTANWTTARPNGMLVVAFKSGSAPAPVYNVPRTTTRLQAVQRSSVA